jgi:hypothetical protein
MLELDVPRRIVLKVNENPTAEYLLLHGKFRATEAFANLERFATHLNQDVCLSM